MASASPALKTSPLQPEDWIRAAFARLASEGIEAVRVELLARDLGVSKGSFYWHFQDREELLGRMFDRWEKEEIDWLDETVITPKAAARWARFVHHCTDQQLARLESAMRTWARRDERVAAASPPSRKNAPRTSPACSAPSASPQLPPSPGLKSRSSSTSAGSTVSPAISISKIPAAPSTNFSPTSSSPPPTAPPTTPPNSRLHAPAICNPHFRRIIKKEMTPTLPTPRSPEFLRTR